MPIVNIQIVGNSKDQYQSVSTQFVANELSKIFKSSLQGTWVKITSIPEYSYAENNPIKDNKEQPVFVRILKRTLPSTSLLREEALILAETIGRILNRPKHNVHVIYEPDALGRIAFGGVLVE